MVQLFIAFALAIVAGGFGALVGIGGGIIVVPVLTIVVGIPIKTAIAASLVGVIATSVASAAPYLERGLADRRIGLILLVATAAGGVFGGVVAGLLDARALAALFGVVLVLVVWQMARSSRERDVSPGPGALESAGLVSSYIEPRTGAEVPFPVRRVGLGFAFSLVAGGISGLLGVGGGIINVPTMHILMGAPLRVATSTSSYMLGATAVASGLIYYARGQIDPLVAAPVALGVFLGARTISRLAPLVRQEVLRGAFIVVALALAAQMFARAAGIA